MEMEQMIYDILKQSKIKKKYIDTLMSPESISFYHTVFTDPSFDKENNYLYVKTLGTLSVHKIIVWYFSRMYPDSNPKILSQMKNNFLHQYLFGEYVEKLGFQNFILFNPNEQKISLNLLQLVFDAFIGATELLINKKHKGIGFFIVEKICTSILENNEFNIGGLIKSDSKTKLKELLQVKRMFLETKESRDSQGIFLIELFLDRVKRGEGRGKKIIDAEQIASQEVLDYLRSIGIFKEKVEKMKYIDARLIYKAPRDIHFVNFISNLLKTVYFLKDLELDQDDISIFAKAFTHPDVSKDNYEFLETLGDNTNNKCVLWYLSNRFPQLNCPDGIDIITKLKINIIKTESFSAFAEELSFFNYISLYKKDQLGNWEQKEILEDVFEAFFAAVEIVVNKKYKYGMGYIACYKLMSSILDKKEYSLQYNDLVLSKTRLKELFDARKDIQIKYSKPEFVIQQNDKIYTSFILEAKVVDERVSEFRKIGNPPIFGKGYTDKQAEEDVSKKAIEYYKSMNIIKHIPKEYLKFCV